MTDFRLPRSSRLKRQQLIRPLFDRARRDVHSVAHGCVRLVYRLIPRSTSVPSTLVQVGFSAGRGVRRAIDRNRIKRHLREVYRLNQSTLAELLRGGEHTLTMMVLFRGLPEQAPSCVPRDLPVALEKASRLWRDRA